MPKDDPSEIARRLARGNGIEGAIRLASDGIAKAHQSGDYYSLSVWREVRQKLKTMASMAEAAGGDDL